MTVLGKGFAWNGKTYGSLSQIAKAMTGTSWNGYRFFGPRTAGLRAGRTTSRRRPKNAAANADTRSSRVPPARGSAAIVGSPFDVTVERIGEALGKVKRAARPALAPPVGTDSEPMMQHWPPQETC